MDRLTIVKAILANPAMFALAVFASTLVLFQLGRLIGARPTRESRNDSLGIVDGSVFALLGLLMAFVFSGAANRFEARRDLIVQEANAVGTARLRIELLPEPVQPAMRDAFDRYVATRRQVYDAIDNQAARDRALAQSRRLQDEIWSIAINNPSAPGEGSDSHRLLLPALNEMFDIATTRVMALAAHVPTSVLATLWLVTLAAAVLAGRASRTISHFPWVSVLTYSALMALVLYLIVDYEYPRHGMIRIDYLDALIQ